MSAASSENLPGGIAAGDAHDTAARMAAGATQIQTVDRRAVLRRARQWTDKEELIEAHRGVVPVTAGHAEFGFDIEGRKQLGVSDQVANARRVAFKRRQDRVQAAGAIAVAIGAVVV